MCGKGCCRGFHYSDYLKSPEWQRIRAVMASRYPICEEAPCQETNKLELHHVTYARLGHEWENDLADLRRLCRRHHIEAENNRVHTERRRRLWHKPVRPPASRQLVLGEKPAQPRRIFEFRWTGEPCCAEGHTDILEAYRSCGKKAEPFVCPDVHVLIPIKCDGQIIGATSRSRKITELETAQTCFRQQGALTAP